MELSKDSNKSISSLQRSFKYFLDNSPIPQIKENNECHLIIDGTYFSDTCLLDYLDNGLKYLQYYSLVKRECYESYLIDLSLLKESGLNVVSITSDGQKGLIKAVGEIFPNIVHQRCIIHIQRMSLIYLTRFPKTKAGMELRKLVTYLHEIDDHEKRDIWIKLFSEWYKKYHNFLQEKSESITGRKWYTHKLLRRTRSLIKNALPNMFHYLDNPNIPKSTNALETRFSYLKNNIRIHRGLSRSNRKGFIMWYNYFKNQD